MDLTNFNLDEVSQVIMIDLCNLKRKHEKKEAELKFYKAVLLIVAAVFLGYVLFFTVIPHQFQYGSMISSLINNVYHYFFIALLVTVNFRLKYIEKKADSAEKEFNALRCEVIQRSEELWPPGAQREKRHLFFKEMKEKYHINLYYEND